MVDTILLSLLFISFYIERLYFYLSYKKSKKPLLNFNQTIQEPFNYNNQVSQNIQDNNLTNYIIDTQNSSAL